jgi:hypothetical protein
MMRYDPRTSAFNAEAYKRERERHLSCLKNLDWLLELAQNKDKCFSALKVVFIS